MSGTLRLRGSTSGYSELQAPAVAADQTFVLPTAGGTLLTTDSPVPKLTLELGSASQPSLTFQGDTDTGLFSEGTNTLNLVTGGSSKVVLGAAAHTIYAGTGATVRAIDIDSSGNVGVGTSSPVGRLTVIGSAGSGDDGVQITSGSTTTGSKAALFFMPSTTASVATGSAIKSERLSPDGSDLQFYTVSALGNTPVRAMTIDKSQRVGIGTTSPSSIFTEKVQTSAGKFEVQESGSSSINVGAFTAGQAMRLVSPAGILFSNSTSGEAARIDNSGRLLVGTSTGVASNTAEFQGNSFSASGPANIYIKLGATNPSSGSAIGNISFSDSSGALAGLISCASDGTWGSGDYPGRLVFSTTADGASSPTERMRIDSSGRLLIGTTTEGYSSADTLTISESGNCGLTLRSGTSSLGTIAFSNATSGAGEYAGYIQYSQTNTYMGFGVGSSEKMRIDKALEMW